MVKILATEMIEASTGHARRGLVTTRLDDYSGSSGARAIGSMG
jgi:hypothetical protein